MGNFLVFDDLYFDGVLLVLVCLVFVHHLGSFHRINFMFGKFNSIFA